MSELTPEQTAALTLPCDCGHEPDDHGSATGCWRCADDGRDPWCKREFLDLLWERLAPMLDQARAEGAAAVVADVEAECDVLRHDAEVAEKRRSYTEASNLRWSANRISEVVARHAPPEATEGPSEARGGAGGVVGSGEAQEAAERRAGPQPHLPDPGRKERR